MFISFRAARVRNLIVSGINGAITLVILLIAPLGLAAVVVNTLLVTVATYGVSQMADRVVAWVSPPTMAGGFPAPSRVDRRKQSPPTINN